MFVSTIAEKLIVGFSMPNMPQCVIRYYIIFIVMTFSVTVLGSGSAKPTPNRHHSAHVLNVHEQFYLVDCGEGTQLQLLRVGINILKINAVFISHLHGDHIYGLFPLISSMGLMGRRVPLTIFAPAPFRDIIDFHFKYFDTALPFEIIFHEVDTCSHQLIYQNTVMEVWSIPLRHRLPDAGFLFREKTPPLNVSKFAIERFGLGIAQIAAAKNGQDISIEDGTLIPNEQITYLPYSPRAYAYCSDTLFSAKAASLVSGADLIYHEATFASEDKALAQQTGHSTAAQAATFALKANAGKLLIGHFSSRYKDDSVLLTEAQSIFPNTETAVELQSYPIAVKRNIHP